MNILIICHANVSRSIMALTLLDRMLADEGVRDRFVLDSAGVAPYARDRALISLDARLALRNHEIEVAETLTSKALRNHLHLLRDADLVLAMTGEQREMLFERFDASGKQVVTLRELAGETGDIEDPATQEHEVFEATCAEVRRCLERALPDLVASLS